MNTRRTVAVVGVVGEVGPSDSPQPGSARLSTTAKALADMPSEYRNQERRLRWAHGDRSVHMSTSLDGFVAGPQISVEQPMGAGGERLHEWMFAPSDPADIETAAEMFATRTTGAVVIGRRTFDVGEQPWGEDGTFHVPCFVVTHRAAPTLVKGKTSFTFVTEGLEHALALNSSGHEPFCPRQASPIWPIECPGVVDARGSALPHRALGHVRAVTGGMPSASFRSRS